MKTVIALFVVAALIAILALDGLAMYAADHKAVRVAEAAAQAAVAQYGASSASATAADSAAEQVAKEAKATLVSVNFHQADTRWVEVTVKVTPHVYLLNLVPYLRAHLAQASTAVVHF